MKIKISLFTVTLLMGFFSIGKAQIPTLSAPIGTIVAYAGQALGLPEEKATGWYVCNGDRIPVSDYPKYAQTVGSIYGTSADGNFVYLPDFRGMFLRGVSGSRADSLKDPDAQDRIAPLHGGLAGNQVGSIQPDAVGPHQHIIPANTSMAGGGGAIYGGAMIASSGFVAGTNGNGGATLTSIPNPSNASQYTPGFPKGLTSTETRPKNSYIFWLIKVK